ncbi:MAG: rhomboid family intramembrane serine protease [Desulfobulbaceae bacterium]|nr:rhomboid family intramembrane serine protease [Desulfobulbaceae bacterium]
MNSPQRKNSLLCPNCRRLISRSDTTCPYCGLKHPAAAWRNLIPSAAFSDPKQLISLIIYTNVGMYILSLLLNPGRTGLAFNPFDFLSPGNRSLLILGSTGTVAIFELHRWWSLLSANYLHGSLLHIIFNMIALKQIGPLVYREYGGYRMFSIYTIGGILGFVLSFLAGVRFTIGASAAVCSLIGAMLYYGKSRGGVYGGNIYSQIGGWAVSIFVFGLLVPGINNWGHGGGMAAGALLGALLGYRERKKENSVHKLLGLGCALLTLLVLFWSCVNGALFLFLA